MTKISGGTVLIRALLDHDVDTIFTLCGNHLLSTYDAVLDATSGAPWAAGRTPRLIDVRHEGAAAHMADAWYRVTGRPGVCLVTGGPGHTNALTGIATAYAADSPVIWLSGASEAANQGMGAMQELDQVGIAQPVTKWSAEVTDLRRLPAALDRAFQVAVTGRPGPVHLSLPVDMLDSVIEEADVRFPRPVDLRAATRMAGSPELIERALAILADAEHPAIIAGAGAFASNAGDAIRRLCQAANLPVFTIDTARGIVSDDDPHCFGYADPVLNPVAALLGKADAILVLGRRLDFRLRYGGIFHPACELVEVSADPTGFGRDPRSKMAIQGDIATVVDQLVGAAPRFPAKDPDIRRTWFHELETFERAGTEARACDEDNESTPLHPRRIVREIRDVLAEDYCLTFDAGDFVQWARQGLPARRPGSWLRLGPMATLGCALPFAIAAKLARPSAQVIALTGDGGLGFYGFELDTAVRHNLPIVVVVANDAGWGMERNLQRGIYGEDRVTAADLRPTRYNEVMTAFGGYGEHVSAPAELGPALKRAIASGRPALLDVATASLPSTLTLASVRRKLERRE